MDGGEGWQEKKRWEGRGEKGKRRERDMGGGIVREAESAKVIGGGAYGELFKRKD